MSSVSGANRELQVVHVTRSANGLPTGKSGMKNNVNQRRNRSRTYLRSARQLGQKNSPVATDVARGRKPKIKIMRSTVLPAEAVQDTVNASRFELGRRVERHPLRDVAVALLHARRD